MPEFHGLSSTDEASTNDADTRLSRVLITLFKGVLYQEVHDELFQALLSQENAVRDYVDVLGLELFVDEGEGFAYLKNREPLEGGAALPRLVAKRPLSFVVSLVLALLRKRLLEAESGGQARLIMSREEMVEMVRVYLPSRTNEAQLVDQVQRTAIHRVVELGFMRELRGQDGVYEVMRIIKAFVDAEWLSDFNEKLTAYLDARGLHSYRGNEELDG